MLEQPANAILCAVAALMIFVLALPGAAAGGVPGPMPGANVHAADGVCPACGEALESVAGPACQQICAGTSCLVLREAGAPTVSHGGPGRQANNQRKAGRATAPEPNPPRLRT